ncbi:Homeobox domain-like,SANT domain [Cinara cedri]|uniref:Homeobox domain-like,SANT domain n=1 Tax=Cinara cedri TaxID=506608 RepID=A0A5E4NAR8_9HEMI|nr:Homeobox domain-like,SANT domain [Cinara cedri]
MAEDRESSDRKSEKSKKRDRPASVTSKNKVYSNIWTEEEKLQLSEAIDMYGIQNLKKLTERVPTKKRHQVEFMLAQLKIDYRRMVQCYDMNTLSFVDLDLVDELFLVGGTKPKEAMVKWMEYLDSFYMNDESKFNKFKLFSKAFLIMSECSTEPETHDQENDQSISFRNVYYFLYRMFNDFHVKKKNNTDLITRKYLYDTFRRVLDDIEYSSDGEKMAMYNIVKNWTSINRIKTLKVYGKTELQTEIEEVGLCLETDKFKVLHQPMIPCFNPFRMKTNIKNSADIHQ